MKSVDLNSIPYKLRSNGASLLIAKANRLSGMTEDDKKPDDRALFAAIAYYDMALALLKPFDSNYSTVINWKCNALTALGQHKDAADWYREIVRISDETDGKARRNATAEHAEKMLRGCVGRRNEPLAFDGLGVADFDEPPHCKFAEEFCNLLTERKFKKAHAYLSPNIRETIPLAKLKDEWQQMTQGALLADIDLSLQQDMLDWPDRKPEAICWLYFSVASEDFSEAVTLVVGRTEYNSYCITELEFGRP